MVAAVAGLFVLHAASNPIAAGDIFWQIRTGEFIAHHHAVPWSDDFAWTSRGKPWIEHEWLADLLDYGVYRLGGFGAVRIAFTLIWICIVLRMFLSVRRSCARSNESVPPGLPGGALVAVGVLLCVCARQYIPAPSTISVLVLLEIILLLRPWRGPVGLARGFLVTVVFCVWVNMHAVAMLLLPLLGLYAGFPLVQSLAATDSHGAPFRARTRFALRSSAGRWGLLVACALVSFATPYTWHIHAYALQGPDIARYVDEWAGLFENDYVGPWTKGVFVLVVLAWVIDLVCILRRRGARAWFTGPRAFYDIIALASIVLALRHARFVWLGEVPLVVTLCANAPCLHRNVHPLAWALTAALLVVAAIRPSGWSPILLPRLLQRRYYTQHFREGTLPIGAAGYLRTHPTPGRMYNHYIWGGYLLFTLYPSYRVFIDGRTVLHGAELVGDATAIDLGSQDTPALLNRYGIRLLVVGANYFPDDVAAGLGWTLRFRDNVSAVYTR